MRRRILSVIACLIMLMAAGKLNAQVPDLPIIHDSIYSQVLKEMRPIEIVLPSGYSNTASQPYDVFYVTDGEWNTRIVSDMRLMLNIQFTPENIIVSMPNVYPNGNNQRGRDFTPTHSDGMPESGGADKFLAFIKTELMPYINGKYKTSGDNTLYGSSLGGIFAMYTFCKDPMLFQSYLIADPAWWWDNNYISKLLKENIDKMMTAKRTMLVTAREGGPYKYMGIATVDSILTAAKTTSRQHWKTMQYNDETHNSMLFRTIYDGLKWTYAGYMKQDFGFHPMNGIVLKDKPVTIHLNNTDLLKNIHFTTDGKTPTADDPQLSADTIAVTGATKLAVTSISNRERFSRTVRGNFTATDKPLAAGAKPKNMEPGGFRYNYYEGNWDSLPDFKKLKPLQTDIAVKDFTISKLPKQQHFACVLEGQLEIKTDGYYIFGIDVSGGARLYIANQLLINYDGIHTSGNFQSAVVPLVKGFYPVKIEYYQKEGKPSLETGYIIPGDNNPDALPLELIYHTKK